MDSSSQSTGPKPDHGSERDLPTDNVVDNSDADRLLEENKKRNTSGLSWDEIAADDKKGWNKITEMGEGD